MNPARRLDEHRLAIFLFHGVVERSDYAVRNYTRKHLLADTFESVIRSLVRVGTPMSMDDVTAHIEAAGPFPPRSFAITFDDGFENNLSVAAPILSDLGVPATFYITSNFVENGAMSWIDRIEVCFERAQPGRVRLPWRAEPAAFATPADKIHLLDEIRARVKADSTIDRDGLISDLFDQCGVAEIHTSGDPLDGKLTWPQVRELGEHSLFTVGGHSHTHATLSFLSEADLHAEIATSINMLRERAGIESCHYSYPEGLDYCYSAGVIEELRSFGIRCCPTAIDGLNDERTGLFHLRRIMVDRVDETAGDHPANAAGERPANAAGNRPANRAAASGVGC